MSDKILTLECKRILYKKQQELTEKLLARYAEDNQYKHELLRPYTLRYAYSVVYAEFYNKCLIETLLYHLRFINSNAAIYEIDENTVYLKIKGVLPNSIAWGALTKGYYNFHVRRAVYNKLALVKSKEIIRYIGVHETSVTRQIDKTEDVYNWYSALMPYEYTDGLQFIEEKCLHVPKNMFVYTSHGMHDDFMIHVIFLYLSMYKNWRITMLQHGGTYQLMNNFITVEAEKSYISEHLYWGSLGRENSASIVPYSKRNFLALECIKILRYIIPKYLCIVALPAKHKYDYRFDDFFQSSAYEELVGEIERSIHKVPHKFCLHPYNQNYSKAVLDNSGYKLTLFKGNILFGLILSRFILIPYNGTVIHEALVSRCPFVIYINEHRDGFDLPNLIKTQMLDLGILHTTEKSLRDFMMNKRALGKWLVDKRVKNMFKELRELLVGL